MKRMKNNHHMKIVPSPTSGPTAPTGLTPVSPVNVEFYNSQNPSAATGSWQSGDNEQNISWDADTETTYTFVISPSGFTYTLQVGGAAGSYSLSFPVDPVTGTPSQTVQAFA